VIGFQVTVKNIGNVFLRDSVFHLLCISALPSSTQTFKSLHNAGLFSAVNFLTT